MANIAVRQIWGNTTANANGTSASAGQSPLATILGNSIVVFALVNDGTVNRVLSDGVNNYSQVDVATDTVQSNYYLFSYLAQNIAGGLVTPAYSWGGATPQYGLIACEVRNVAAMPLDAHNKGFQPTPGTGSDVITTAADTNQVQPSLILGCAYHNSSSDLSIGTGFNMPTNGAWNGSVSVGGVFMVEQKRITAAGSQVATWTTGADGSNSALSLMLVLNELVNTRLAQEMMMGVG